METPTSRRILRLGRQGGKAAHILYEHLATLAKLGQVAIDMGQEPYWNHSDRLLMKEHGISLPETKKEGNRAQRRKKNAHSR